MMAQCLRRLGPILSGPDAFEVFKELRGLILRFGCHKVIHQVKDMGGKTKVVEENTVEELVEKGGFFSVCIGRGGGGWREGVIS